MDISASYVKTMAWTANGETVETSVILLYYFSNKISENRDRRSKVRILIASTECFLRQLKNV